jgi:hypothetical protein
VKKIVLALALSVATAAAANAQTAAAKPAAPKAGSQAKADTKAAGKGMAMKGEVVSTDATAKTITVKDASGTSTTLTATGGAVASLAGLKPGDQVMVTHSDTSATKITKVKGSGGKKSGGKS